jgi:hypothetical protein
VNVEIQKIINQQQQQMLVVNDSSLSTNQLEQSVSDISTSNSDS